MSHLSDSQTGSARSGRHRGEEGDERRSGAGGWAVGKAVRGRNRDNLPSARKRRNRTEAIKASRGALFPSPNREVKASSRPHFAADPRKAEGFCFARPPSPRLAVPSFLPSSPAFPFCCCRWWYGSPPCPFDLEPLLGSFFVGNLGVH